MVRDQRDTISRGTSRAQHNRRMRPSMRLSVGADIVEISRFEQMEYSSCRSFYERVFTTKEIKYCLSFKNPAPHFAVNFAGKEAVCKAIQMSCNAGLRRIEILRDKRGAPRVNLHLDRKDGKKESTWDGTHFQIQLSLSHSSSYAIAFALANHTRQRRGVSV